MLISAAKISVRRTKGCQSKMLFPKPRQPRLGLALQHGVLMGNMSFVSNVSSLGDFYLMSFF